MDVVRFVIPAAMLLALAGGFFGVVVARVVWADDANNATKIKTSYEEIQRSYNKIHETDQDTIATMQRTIDILRNPHS